VLVDGNWRFVNAFWGACVQTDEDGQEGIYSVQHYLPGGNL